MQRRPFARKPLHASPSSSRKSLDEVKRAVDTCLQNLLHSKEDGVQNAVSLLDQLESNAFKQSPMVFPFLQNDIVGGRGSHRVHLLHDLQCSSRVESASHRIASFCMHKASRILY